MPSKPILLALRVWFKKKKKFGTQQPLKIKMNNVPFSSSIKSKIRVINGCQANKLTK